jgi:hypothetical protein
VSWSDVEYVAVAAQAADFRAPRASVGELAPQLADQSIDTAIVRLEWPIEGELREFRSGKHFAATLQQRSENAPLGGGEMYWQILYPQLASFEVQLQIADQ